MRNATVFFTVAVFLLPSAAFGREWMDATGRFSVDAKLVEISGDAVVLETDGGKVVTVPIARLRRLDQDYVSHRRIIDAVNRVFDLPKDNDTLARKVQLETDAVNSINGRDSRDITIPLLISEIEPAGDDSYELSLDCPSDWDVGPTYQFRVQLNRDLVAKTKIGDTFLLSGKLKVKYEPYAARLDIDRNTWALTVIESPQTERTFTIFLDRYSYKIAPK